MISAAVDIVSPPGLTTANSDPQAAGAKAALADALPSALWH
jgi:hypothetical protein